MTGSRVPEAYGPTNNHQTAGPKASTEPHGPPACSSEAGSAAMHCYRCQPSTGGRHALRARQPAGSVRAGRARGRPTASPARHLPACGRDSWPAVVTGCGSFAVSFRTPALRTRRPPRVTWPTSRRAGSSVRQDGPTRHGGSPPSARRSLDRRARPRTTTGDRNAGHRAPQAREATPRQRAPSRRQADQPGDAALRGSRSYSECTAACCDDRSSSYRRQLSARRARCVPDQAVEKSPEGGHDK